MNGWTRGYQPATIETATDADGPKIVEWLGQRGHLDRLILRGDSVDRRVRAWRNGENPTFYTADRYLAVLDIHPSELPDEVWLVRTVETKAAA